LTVGIDTGFLVRVRRCSALLSMALVAIALLIPGATQAADSTWRLATKRAEEAAAAPAYLGNGYVGTRIPADGAGYVPSPVATETHIAGVYANVPTRSAVGFSARAGSTCPAGHSSMFWWAGSASGAPMRGDIARCSTCAEG
jgi:hypothetical protein